MSRGTPSDATIGEIRADAVRLIAAGRAIQDDPEEFDGLFDAAGLLLDHAKPESAVMELARLAGEMLLLLEKRHGVDSGALLRDLLADRQ